MYSSQFALSTPANLPGKSFNLSIDRYQLLQGVDEKHQTRKQIIGNNIRGDPALTYKNQAEFHRRFSLVAGDFEESVTSAVQLENHVPTAKQPLNGKDERELALYISNSISERKTINDKLVPCKNMQQLLKM